MGLSTFLGGQTPTQLRGLQWLGLTDTGIVISGTFVSDAGGGGSIAWANGGTTACRIDPLGGAPGTVVGGAIDENSTHLVTVPAGFVVDVASRFAINGRGTYEVTAVRERTRQHTQVFEVLRLQ